MCKAQHEGGQRCAAHTRPAYEAAVYGSDAWMPAATAYASTVEGAQRLEQEATAAAGSGDLERAASMQQALRDGQVLRAVNKQVEAKVKASGEWQPGASHPTGGYTDRVEDRDGSTTYVRDGVLHRLDGPAVEHEDGTKQFWRDGEYFCRYECLKASTAPADCSRLQ